MSAAVEQSRKKASPSPSSGLWSLPDEIAIDCFARVSRVDHAALSMTSKSNRSLVVSPELYETRSRMGCTEECVYVFIDSPFEPNPRWFILRRGRGSVNNNRNRLIPIPSFPTPRSATLVSLGCGIYVIGGFKKCLKTALVSYLDCRTHTWSYLPSMSVARAEARAGVLDGKIYVFGGCVEDPSIWAEVFDPKLQTWSRVVIPEDLMKATEVSKVVQGEETITVSCNFPRVQGLWNDFNFCATDRLLYCTYADGSIMWCDPLSGVRQGAMVWRHVYGLNALKPLLSTYPVSDSNSIFFRGDLADVWQCYLLSHGHKNGLDGFMPGNKLVTSSRGNILVFWDVLVGDADPKTLEIWCAEISMQMWEGYRWGNVLWSEVVFSTDPRFGFHVCYSVSHSVSVHV